MAHYAHTRVIGKYVRPYCGCGLAMTVKTAWTREHPGKRFIACPKYGSKCEYYEFFHDDLPSEYYRELLYEEHQKVKKGNQRNEMQEHIVVLTMEKKLLVEELNCTKSKLQLYNRLFLILIAKVSGEKWGLVTTGKFPSVLN
ncbi:hypothetical protein CTI12_AA488680 [Artemisia annua]|uniref:Zinc finger GRF-type domain-containing protein n=1 Tax=Artemisia annua TaxID=35608 RepID=A0A2U1LI47_ARTAN|nr:hypothetical protein CTI12_AA488680 [Artemisia annua]